MWTINFPSLVIAQLPYLIYRLLSMGWTVHVSFHSLSQFYGCQNPRAPVSVVVFVFVCSCRDAATHQGFKTSMLWNITGGLPLHGYSYAFLCDSWGKHKTYISKPTFLKDFSNGQIQGVLKRDYSEVWTCHTPYNSQSWKKEDKGVFKGRGENLETGGEFVWDAKVVCTTNFGLSLPCRRVITTPGEGLDSP